MGGRWEQLRSGAATHLPFRAGHNWMRTAKAGYGTGASAPVFFIINSVYDRLKAFL